MWTYRIRTQIRPKVSRFFAIRWKSTAKFLHAHLFQIGDYPGRGMFLKLDKLETPGGHGQHFRANGTSTGDVEWGVADYENFLPAQISSHDLLASFARDDGNLIAVFVIIAESAS